MSLGIQENPFILEIVEESKKLDHIKDLLKETSSENPLDPRIKEKDLLGKIELRDPKKVIRVKPMLYSPDDRKEFDIQIKELLNLGIIVPSESPHSSPAFLVENEAERRRGRREW